MSINVILPHFGDMAYFPISELQDIDVVGLEWLWCLTYGDHTSVDTIYENHLALLIKGKAFYIEGDVSHMLMNLGHPFGVVI